MTNPEWTSADLPRFDGRTVVVTGANSGIGLVTARELARVGARVVLAVRDTARGAEAAQSIPGHTEVRELDLADLASVRRFAADWSGDIDVLVNNAGIMLVPAGRTEDGFERQFGTNHLGHFALTNLLLPHITDRVVTISSQAHRRGSIDLDDLNWETRTYNSAAAYGQSKLANLLFTLELQRRFSASGSRLALSAHPGWSATNLQSHSGNRILHEAMRVGNKLLAQNASSGALPTLFAASQQLPPGSYVGPDGWFEVRGYPKVVGRSTAAANADLAAALWTASEELTEVRFPANA
ncbi:oxidoreductase [Nocardia sp. NPDC052112]|uniref:oxidoreductase n=1 Tax=Nocardia sp. NPDC052112 TaxID=3155646 RepID=UPI003415E267